MSISYLTAIAEKIRHEDKSSILDIRNEVNDPITEELCLAFIQYYIQNGRFYSRWIKYEDEPTRGKDSIGTTTLITNDNNIKSNRAAMNHALEIIMSESQKGHFYVFNRVNSEYKKEIFNLYYSGQLEHYLKTGEADAAMGAFLDRVYKDCYSLASMYSSDGINKCFLDHHTNTPGYCANSPDFRFYINMPFNDKTALFVRDYQILCQELGIPFEMKPFKNRDIRDKDSTVFYSFMEDLPIHISILRELLKIYPDMQLGAPPIACASLEDLPSIGFSNNGYNLSYAGINANKVTYNSVIDNVFDAVLSCFASMHFMNGSNFSEKTKENMRKQLNSWERVRAGEQLDGICYPCVYFNSEENLQVRQYLSNMMSDPLRKKVMANFFMDNIRLFYNAMNGFPSDYPSNIAFDARYINEKIGRMQHPQPQNGSHPKR